ncbi:MAG: YhbY family RNA-binding protein [Cellvibrionaceae bacterium]|nr:YhbY family RNA-binding protein [Cellvibrionaceae bacterium]
MTLSADRKKQYRNIGHNLKPVVTVAGNGLSETVLEELNRALEDHELIKVKLVVADRDLRKQVIAELCKASRSELVQEIGKVALVFRAAKKPNTKLSNLLRA